MHTFQVTLLEGMGVWLDKLDKQPEWYSEAVTKIPLIETLVYHSVLAIYVPDGKDMKETEMFRI